MQTACWITNTTIMAHSSMSPKLKRSTVCAGGVLLIAAIALAWMFSDTAAAPCVSIKNSAIVGNACVVTGDLLLDGDVRALPGDLLVKGNLTIRGTSIRQLPAGLVVEGNLTLYKTYIARLPADLKVGGALDTYAGFGSPVILCSEIPATVVIEGTRGCGN